MEQIFTVAEIGQSIEHWCRTKPMSGPEMGLCREAQVLAEVLGMMIFSRRQTVPAGELNEEQLQALEESKGTEV